MGEGGQGRRRKRNERTGGWVAGRVGACAANKYLLADMVWLIYSLVHTARNLFGRNLRSGLYIHSCILHDSPLAAVYKHGIARTYCTKVSTILPRTSLAAVYSGSMVLGRFAFVPYRTLR